MGFANKRIAVVGGGLGGMSFMNSALHSGLTNVHLYEAAPQFTEVGAGVNITANANRLIDNFGIGKDMLWKSSHDPPSYMDYYHYRTGEFLGRIDEFSEPSSRQIHRAHLLEAFQKHIPQLKISLGKRLTSLDWSAEKSCYVLSFRDGTTAEADIVVACDGIKSVVRQLHLGLTDNPVYSGQMVYRGYVSYDDLTPKTAALLRATVNFRGPQRHVLTLPIGNDESMTSRVGVIAFMTEPLENWDSESWLKTAPVDDLYEHVKDWTGAVQEIIEGLRKGSSDGRILKQALYVREPTAQWYQISPRQQDSGVVLVGDSVHSTLPHQGQGACQAIESGFTLAQILKNWKSTDLGSALKFYQDFRKPRTDRITRSSYETGKMASADIPEDQWAAAFNPAMTRERMKWVMEYDLLADLADKLEKVQEASVSTPASAPSDQPSNMEFTSTPSKVALEVDEKDEKHADSSSPRPSVSELTTQLLSQNNLQRWFKRLDEKTGLEARGIERVPESLRHPRVTAGSYVQMFLIWFSINCTANNMTIGILGPATYGLGLTDAMVCCLFGTIFGAICTGYISSFGPVSGLRTLVIARFTMGYWPSKLCVLLNLVIELGYGLVDCLVAGLILSAVNGAGLTVIVGIVITAIITWIVATFGIKWFHTFEKYVWIPTVLILFILIGCAGPHFDTKTPSSSAGAALQGARVSYFFLCASGPLGWSPASADFYSYYPVKTDRRMISAMTASGITTGKLLIEFLGIGLGSGIALNAEWAAALSDSPGHLIAEAFTPLGGFGKFCATILALCVAANNIPGMYAAALNWQMFGHYFARIPRPIWCTVSCIISTVCAIAGREHLFSIFLNFLSLIGYWTIIWITMTLEEEFIFRRKTGYNWTGWNDKTILPTGYAGFATFIIGWVGAIICMSQTYYTGPIAAMAGDGTDLGLPVSMAWAAIVYPPLRHLELKFLGR
ncbi:FAD/NAD(P)-binding domain-containing protein [Jackrogersella minutella]|nr:FAD/NAD(P)-binding domain-containing protein [Jackrogersella minutella]